MGSVFCYSTLNVIKVLSHSEGAATDRYVPDYTASHQTDPQSQPQEPTAFLLSNSFKNFFYQNTTALNRTEVLTLAKMYIGHPFVS
jgi:hypothetical protein